MDGALNAAERLRSRVTTLTLLPKLTALRTPPFSLTCSVGVASFPFMPPFRRTSSWLPTRQSTSRKWRGEIACAWRHQPTPLHRSLRPLYDPKGPC